MIKMGLDNGIIMKRVPVETLSDLPDFFKYDIYYNEDKTIDIDIAYWRKCWGIRDAFAEAMGTWGSQCVDFDFYRDDIPDLLDALQPFLEKDYWDACSQSIWEYDEMLETNQRIYQELEWLYDYLKDSPDVKMRFYDSW